MPKKKPKILEQHIAAQSHFFQVESLHLEFSNGERRVYERLVGGQRGAVMIVPVNADNQLLLIKEYAAATERYELSFPKGAIDPGEEPQQAANRELQEEVGFAAQNWHMLKEVTVAPSYFGGAMQIFVADELYPSRLLGDEPEPLAIETVPVDECMSLLEREEFSEARTIAALYLFNQWWQKNRR
ncbi:ADP compounds hydrolase NudE [Celerinatantimonas sp. MCCC 1A17872]|uniref:ADP compounds hydrolase NudE n=1 Tax=Celerinatantimonas sp. MCCC 1A17872 TaxID=3177514 RepID=UPI0038BFDE08